MNTSKPCDWKTSNHVTSCSLSSRTTTISLFQMPDNESSQTQSFPVSCLPVCQSVCLISAAAAEVEADGADQLIKIVLINDSSTCLLPLNVDNHQTRLCYDDAGLVRLASRFRGFSKPEATLIVAAVILNFTLTDTTNYGRYGSK